MDTTAETRTFTVGQEVIEIDTGRVGVITGIAAEPNSVGRPIYDVAGLTYPQICAMFIIPADGPRIRCGCCGNLHGSVAEVGECYQQDAEAAAEAAWAREVPWG